MLAISVAVTDGETELLWSSPLNKIPKTTLCGCGAFLSSEICKHAHHVAENLDVPLVEESSGGTVQFWE